MVPAITPLAFEGSHLFQNLSVDLITNLPPVNGLDSVMIMVNHGLSEGVILTSCGKTVNAAGIAQLFSNTSSSDLDYTSKLCQTEDPSLPQPSPGNLQDCYNMT